MVTSINPSQRRNHVTVWAYLEVVFRVQTSLKRICSCYENLKCINGKNQWKPQNQTATPQSFEWLCPCMTGSKIESCLDWPIAAVVILILVTVRQLIGTCLIAQQTQVRQVWQARSDYVQQPV